MGARLRTLWENVSTSLRFVPGLLVRGAVLLAWSAASFSLDPDTGGAASRWLYSGNAEDALTLLKALLPAMISMATLVISITMVVLVLAAGQLGPRLIRNSIASVPTQLMLGFFGHRRDRQTTGGYTKDLLGNQDANPNPGLQSMTGFRLDLQAGA